MGNDVPSAEEIEAGGGRKRALQGYYLFPGEDGEDCLMLVLSDVTVFPPMKKFKNKKEEEFYWKPYAMYARLFHTPNSYARH